MILIPLLRIPRLLIFCFPLGLLAAEMPGSCESYAHPQALTATLQHTQRLAMHKQFDAAIGELDRAVQAADSPNTEASLLMFAGSLSRVSGDLARAHEYLARAMALATPSNMLRHQILAEQANVLLDQGQYAAVLDLYENAAVCDGPFVKPSFELGLAKLYLQDYDGVKRITRQAFHYLESVLPTLPLVLDAPFEEERRWGVLAMHADCYGEAKAACAQSWWRVLHLVNRGPKSEWARASLEDHVQRLASWPEGDAVVRRARAIQFLDDKGKLVPDKLPLVPQIDFDVKSFRIPTLPRRVASGQSWGWVVLHVLVDHKGQVDDTEVIFARPAEKGFERPSERAARTTTLRMVKPVAEGETVRVLMAIIYNPGGVMVWPAQ